MSIGTKRRLELPGRRPVEVPINLLPKEIVGEQRIRRVFGYATIVAGVLVFLLIVLTVQQRFQISSQQKALTKSQAEAAALQTQIGALAQYDQLNRSVVATRQTLASVLVGDVSWTRFLDDLDHRIPGDSSLSSLTMTATPGTTPDGQPSFGTIAYSGTVGSFPGLAGWLDTMSASSGLHFVYLGSGTKAGTVSFSASAFLTNALLSGRCQTEAAPCP